MRTGFHAFERVGERPNAQGGTHEKSQYRDPGFCVSTRAGNAALAAPGQPNFGDAIFADGEAWGTKGNGSLPPPDDHNRQSFDDLYQFTNGVAGQLPVAEAGPCNPDYNGGRWAVIQVTWTEPREAVLITSAEQLYGHDLQFIEIGTYFQCPLLPFKS